MDVYYIRELQKVQGDAYGDKVTWIPAGVKKIHSRVPAQEGPIRNKQADE